MALRFENVGVRTGPFTLSGNLTVDAGGIVAVIGPSGAGKSTLLSLVAGFLVPDQGRVFWKETDLAPLAPGQRPVSIVFQDQNLFPHLSVAENVGLGISPSLRLSKRENQRVEAALAKVGLAGRGREQPGSLSGGEQSRVALARVLLRDQPILLLDEAFSALGPALKAEMYDLVGQVTDALSATTLIVTHDPSDALKFAPRTILVDSGKVHEAQHTEDLFADPPTVLRQYLGI